MSPRFTAMRGAPAALLLVMLLVLAAPAAAEKLDLNRATSDELAALPGIGRALAERIVTHRAAQGPFKTVYDLMKVEGVSGEIFQPLVDRIEVAGSAASPSPPARVAGRVVEEPSASPASGEVRRAPSARAGGGEPVASGRIGRAEATPDAVFKAGFGLARRGKFDKAGELFEQFIQANPGHRYVEDARYLAAACLEETEKYPQAIEAYRKVYETAGSPYRAIALFRLAVCEDLREDFAAALAAYEKFLAEFPDSQWRPTVEARVKEIK